MIFVRWSTLQYAFSLSSVFLIPTGMHVKKEGLGFFLLLGKIPFLNFLNIAWYLRQYDSHWV